MAALDDLPIEKQLTAMQQLIAGLEALPKKCYFLTPDEVIKHAKELLEVEKEQILQSFISGDERGTKEVPFNAEQYFSQTYKQ